MNYKNYDENALADYLKTYGIDKSATKQLYQYVIENPATYLSYSIGYYELNKLEKEMAASLGKSFKISDFHEAVLNVGSCNFAILRQEILLVYTRFLNIFNIFTHNWSFYLF